MEKITPNTTLKEAIKNPMAKDMIEKLFLVLRLPASLAQNGFVGNLKLKALTSLSAGLFTKKTIQNICDMFNLEKNEIISDEGELKKKWWKEAIIYQIYPRSFYDSNGDGIGDLRGITEKLDYIKDLGVTAIWCSPFYDSPNDDYGYDIRDYKKIMAEFGTMEDFDTLHEEIHKRGMKLIIDLVVNHTSDEHEWFRQALQSKDNPYHDYYIWKDATDGGLTPPNNWKSLFKGSAWNYYEHLDQWALHLFSKKQMDLNWENKNVRNDVYEMMNWWLEKGIDGFRMDVINFISKTKGLPEANAFLGVPYIFQGQELSMGNVDFTCIEELNDVETVNTYKELAEKGKNKEKAFQRAKTGTRDNARSPFQWSDSENAGFTKGTPWLKISSDYRRFNAQDEEKREDSVLNFFKKAIALRKSTPALVYGVFKRAENIKAPLYCYYREYENELYYVELNLGKAVQERPIDMSNAKLLLSTKGAPTDKLGPYEGNIYKLIKISS